MLTLHENQFILKILILWYQQISKNDRWMAKGSKKHEVIHLKTRSKIHPWICEKRFEVIVWSSSSLSSLSISLTHQIRIAFITTIIIIIVIFITAIIIIIIIIILIITIAIIFLIDAIWSLSSSPLASSWTKSGTSSLCIIWSIVWNILGMKLLSLLSLILRKLFPKISYEIPKTAVQNKLKTESKNLVCFLQYS